MVRMSTVAVVSSTDSVKVTVRGTVRQGGDVTREEVERLLDMREDGARDDDVRVVDVRLVDVGVVGVPVDEGRADEIGVDVVRAGVEPVENKLVDVEREKDRPVEDVAFLEPPRVSVPLRVTVAINSVTVVVVLSRMKVTRGIVMKITLGSLLEK